MAEPSYSEQVWSAVRSPDAWDAGGTVFASSEQAFKETPGTRRLRLVCLAC